MSRRHYIPFHDEEDYGNPEFYEEKQRRREKLKRKKTKYDDDDYYDWDYN